MAKNKKAATGNRESRIPYSGQIIAAVLQAFDIEIASPNPRTVRRYLSGASLNPHNESELFLSIGQALVDKGIVPVPGQLEKISLSMPLFLMFIVARSAVQWDALVAKLQSQASPDIDLKTLAAGFLRLVMVDLALRGFALLRLCRIAPPPAETPVWAYPNGGGMYLRRLLEESGITRKQLAARMEVSDNSVDNWCDGLAKPNSANLALIGNQLPAASGSYLLLHFALAEISDNLATVIGRDTVIELAAALCRFISMLTQIVNEVELPPIEKDFDAELRTFFMGSGYANAIPLLQALAADEDDPAWKADIKTAVGPWEWKFDTLAVEASGHHHSAGLAQDLWAVPSLSAEQAVIEEAAEKAITAEMAASYAQSPEEAVARWGWRAITRVLDSYIAIRRNLVEQHPLSANTHQQLGACLGKMAELSGDRKLLEEGIAECKIAAAILPGWDVPLVEPAIMLGNVGLYDRALEELTLARKSLTQETPHFLYCHGYVLMCLGRYQEALEAFEQVLAAAPNYAIALNDAACCAFELGDRTKGQRYAKQADRAGHGYAYLKWRWGGYDKPGAKRVSG